MIYSTFLATQSNYIFPIKQVAWLLGKIMDYIFIVIDKMGIGNIALAIIIFTVIVNLLMLPMTIKQQKFTKLNAVMMPEIKAIQDKYKGRQQDQDAMMKQNAEVQAVYQKYGTSPTGSCLYLAIQMPILFGLYQVIYKIPGYVDKVYTAYQTNIVAKIVEWIGTDADKFAQFQEFYASNYARASQHKLESIEELANYATVAKGDNTAVVNHIIDMFYTLKIDKLTELQDMMGITFNTDVIDKMNNFFGVVNISQTPQYYVTHYSQVGILAVVIAILIPVLSMVSQIISMKISTEANGQQNTNSDDPTAQSMKMMNNIMPIMSLVICFTLPSGLGIYWVASAVVRVIIQLIINAYLSKMDIDEFVKKNIEKANEKRAKRGLPPNKVTSVASQSVKNVQNQEELDARKQARAEERERKIKEASEYYSNRSGKKGGLASKANMVKQYDEKNNN